MDGVEIRSIVAAKRPEGLQLEFKREPPGSTDAAKSEFLADVCAMANAHGGTILYGVAEVDGCADSIIGIDGSNQDALRLRLDNIIRSGIEPRIPRLALDVLDADGLAVLAVRIGPSLTKPHWVSARGERRFYVRTTVGKAPMSLDEIRAAFQSSGDTLERAIQWRQRSVSRVAGELGNVGSLTDTIWMVLHLCPLTAFSGSLSPIFDPRPHRDHIRRLKTVSTENTNCRPHYEGLITEERGPENNALYERLLIYRDFRVEAAWRAGHRTDHGKMIYAGGNEQRLNDWLDHFRNWARENRYPFPALVFLSVINTDASFVFSSFRRHEATADRMDLRFGFFESAESEPATIMRDAYDHLWQAYGFDHCLLYDDQGQFDRTRYNPRGM